MTVIHRKNENSDHQVMMRKEMRIDWRLLPYMRIK